MDRCKHCNFSCYPNRSNFKIIRLDGTEINVNSKMYCSRECFVMKNILNNNYDCLFGSYPSLGKNIVQRSMNLCFDKNEK